MEADIDPGASIMDRDQADLAFSEIVDGWLRVELAGEAGGLLPELVLHDPGGTVRLIGTILDHDRRHRAIAHDAPGDLAPLADDFREAAEGFDAFVSGKTSRKPIPLPSRAGSGTRRRIRGAPELGAWGDHVRLLTAELDAELVTGGGHFRQYRKKGRWIAAARNAGASRGPTGERFNSAAQAHYARCCAACRRCGSPPPAAC